MTTVNRSDATTSLVAHARGAPNAAAEILPAVYETLRRIAGNLMRHERPDHTLQPTALVNEAYLRLIHIDQVDWKGKAHFRNMAAREMRRILVDHARKRTAAKRGGQQVMVSLDEEALAAESNVLELLALHEALDKLATRNRRQSRMAELRIFSGMSVKEVAYLLEVSPKTVTNDWQFVKVWLAKELRATPRSNNE